MATKTWDGTDPGNEGDVNVAANWSPSGVPIATDDVVIDSSSTQDMTANLDALAAIELADIFINDSAIALGTAAEFLKLKWSGTLRIMSASISGGIVANNVSAEVAEFPQLPNTDGQFSIAGGKWKTEGVGLLAGHLSIVNDPKSLVATIIENTAGVDWVVDRGATLRIGQLTTGSPKLDEIRAIGTVIVYDVADATNDLFDIDPGGLVRIEATGATAIAGMRIEPGGTLEHFGANDLKFFEMFGASRFTKSGDDEYAIGATARPTIDGNATFEPGAFATFPNDLLIQTKGAPLVLNSGADITITMPAA